jgi:hypothetical protein
MSIVRSHARHTLIWIRSRTSFTSRETSLAIKWIPWKCTLAIRTCCHTSSINSYYIRRSHARFTPVLGVIKTSFAICEALIANRRIQVSIKIVWARINALVRQIKFKNPSTFCTLITIYSWTFITVGMARFTLITCIYKKSYGITRIPAISTSTICMFKLASWTS